MAKAVRSGNKRPKTPVPGGRDVGQALSRADESLSHLENTLDAHGAAPEAGDVDSAAVKTARRLALKHAAERAAARRAATSPSPARPPARRGGGLTAKTKKR